MLNISKYKVTPHINFEDHDVLRSVENKQSSKVLRRIIYVSLLLTLIILFLPWTQNIRAKGSVTTLRPEQKPQSIQSVIEGRIEEWYVIEGNQVKKGDTILKISEVKDAYFDKNLLQRTEEQIRLKKEAVKTYGDKMTAQAEQIELLKQQRELSLQQLYVKVSQKKMAIRNDSIAHVAALVNLETMEKQFNRMDSLYNVGLKSLTDLEGRRLNLQKAKAYEFETGNKLFASRNDLINLQLEISNTKMKYDNDLSKLLSERLSTASIKLEAENEVTKLENQYSNYSYRNGLYFITAPQSGFITKMMNSGIGEIIKPGQELVTIMPADYNLAVQLFVEPIDLPLLDIGQEVRIQFDGWPAIVFSGWPNVSHGTYGGRIYAIDQYISENGKYRILVQPDPDDYEWPKDLRYGGGASNMILLNDVPIWYELWRKINGFPPDYYKKENTTHPKKAVDEK